MTAQITDTIVYQDRDFRLVGINGNDLFHPDQIGLQVVTMSTACYRGFYCTYTIRDDHLLLTQLTVGLDEEDCLIAERGEGPTHFGLNPQRKRLPCSRYDRKTQEMVQDTYWSNWYYDELTQLVEFTGKLLIGADFIQEMYVHMGYHPAYKYREVHELIFQSGHLESAHDRSEKMVEFRDRVANRPLSPSDLSDQEGITDWIKQSFSRNYNW